MEAIDKIVANFPKTRPLLDPRIQKIYHVFYKENRQGRTPVSFQARKMEHWIHKKVASLSKPGDKNILEIGAGNLNHVPFETNFETYDVIEPMFHLYSDSNYRGQVSHFFEDIGSIKHTQKYDRIISITAFEHILNLTEVIKKSIQLLNHDGRLTVAIPSEGYFLWGLAWKLTTGLEFKLKYHLNYGNLMRHEHVNTAYEIKLLLKHAFRNTTLYRFGFLNQFSLFQIIDCKNPILQNIQMWPGVENINE